LAGSLRVRSKEKLYWNAARPYRIWGVVCAALGTVLWGFVFAMIFYHAAVNGHGGIYSMSIDE